MRGKAPQVPIDPDSSERRSLPRKGVLLSGVVADLDGEIAFDCTIRDMNAQSAQIGFANKFPMVAQIYLLDTGSRTAHLANVTWSNSHSAGLSFVRSCAIGFALPPKLKFLWRLLLEANLREVDRVVAGGIAVGLAFQTVDLSEVQLDRMARHAGDDKEFARLILRAKSLLSNGPIAEAPIDRRKGLGNRRNHRRRGSATPRPGSDLPE